ncbi:MAG: HlyC/CorC family transporter [Opitutales bacterium]|nr:HlyC/CorC family transporter [Opitutales bacterium]
MSLLVLAILLTLSVSAFCSLLEAFILSTTTADIESLRMRRGRSGRRLEAFKANIGETTTAILTLNTVANTAGMSAIAAITVAINPGWVVWVTTLMIVGILLLSEILPKNIGVNYRRPLAPYLVFPLWGVLWAMRPFTWLTARFLRNLAPREENAEHNQEEEIRLLAARSAQAGTLSDSERDLITNALRLDDVNVEDIMTPRTVVSFLSSDRSVGEVCSTFKNLPFSRIPVFGESFDDILGIVKRRDLLQAYSEDRDALLVRDLMKKPLFVPETASALDAMELLLRKHRQLAVVVDEYGSTAGVVTMEDIFEELIGEEIYDETDVAVDMRELAKKRAQKQPAVTPSTAGETASAGEESRVAPDRPVSPAKSG